MRPNEFTRAVHIIEDEYGGPDNVPDDAWEEFADFRKAYFRKDELHAEATRNYRMTSRYNKEITNEYAHMSTSQMTLEQIMDRLNLNPDITGNGKFPHDLTSVRWSMHKRGLPYIHVKENDVSNRSALGGYIK